jgi:uncharacterized protein (TIGR03067 family)
MKTLLILTGVVLSYMVAFAWQSSVPAALQGKWKLSADNKLIGSIDIKADGKYSYTVLPNYREAGTVTFGAGGQAKDINLVAIGGKGSSVTKGIYTINGNTLTLCLANVNEPRPVNFNGSNSARSIVWTGTK